MLLCTETAVSQALKLFNEDLTNSTIQQALGGLTTITKNVFTVSI